MRLFAPKHQKSIYDLFGDLSQILVVSSEALSRAFGEAPSERPVLIRPIEKGAADAAKVTRRIANILAVSLITPFEAEVLHELSHRMSNVAAQIHRTADLTVRLGMGSLPPRLLDAATVLERAAGHTVEATWEMSDVAALSTFYDEMRRMDTHVQELLRRALTDLLRPSPPENEQAGARAAQGAPNVGSVSTSTMETPDLLGVLRTREIIAAMEEIAHAHQAVAQTVDLLRVKDS
ncbi:hypothetical protein MHY20_03670 [Helcobacillus sp. ACRRO]|uniref:DUF47 domain-containing protein n=1 Tax=Helcobacillus sp. ACRRO TaxID=2918202 RepID=UPI001EF3F358|nr:hypothetical protein [Helcobacillus sp. ACRRO]MCG7426718.1 hypothetical protein [Helcobacillus sp. ACRRO]